jgi:hypothetical protein
LKGNQQFLCVALTFRNLNYSLRYLTINPNVKETNSGIDYISVYLHITETINENKKLNNKIINNKISNIIHRLERYQNLQ